MLPYQCKFHASAIVRSGEPELAACRVLDLPLTFCCANPAAPLGKGNERIGAKIETDPRDLVFIHANRDIGYRFEIMEPAGSD